MSGLAKDDIIRMAREAGGDDWGIFRDFMPEIERFAALVAAAEREAIEQRVLKSNMTMANRLYVVNDLIRARGNDAA